MLLQLLLLLSVLLLQLLRLLLMLLLQGLLFRFIGRLLRETLMVFILLGLQVLLFLHLFRFQFLLLLLESHVVLGVTGVWSGMMFRLRNILGMDCWRRASVFDARRAIVLGWTGD